MFKANLGFFFLHLAQILILEALAWVIVWHFGSGWLVTIFISCLLTVAQAQSSFLQHDMGHLSIFKKSKWNHLMQKFVMGHLKGLSVKWWNNRHFQHHVKTNIYPKDPDIDVGPFFVFGDLQPRNVSGSGSWKGLHLCLEIRLEILDSSMLSEHLFFF
ncbi:hypothetical protein FD755_016973 [Muntiacus reevesi]|uniref:Fatty acid desaturase domain-containing protein n=1 Tax=Muntiacus reevesi TaxID=9886 RepID=A0A5N3X931_MUNRE|nr:hypothetical protein FD755_016973 [Muntiacus reevesi]